MSAMADFRRLATALALASSFGPALAAQAPPPQASPAPSDPPTLYFEEFEPRSTLVVPAHPTPRAKFPFVDVHSHHRAASLTAAEVDELVRQMDALNMAVMVNLSGGSGETLATGIRNLGERYPNRFVTFANVSYEGIDDPAYGERAAAQLAADVAAGARGLKIFKDLGMFAKDAKGERIPTNDPRLDPIWAKCAELGIPVLIHTGEPSPFFEPHDRFNERWLELKERPGRKRPPDQFPSFETLLAEQHALFRKHPKTTFIDAHLGWLGNDLGRLGRLLDELPNVVTELGAVLAELGRQPRAAREFLLRYQDRVLMGKDSWEPSEYPTYFRVFETADEYFDYYRKRHAHWQLYGLELPDEVLRKIYFENALRVVPGLDRALFPGKA